MEEEWRERPCSRRWQTARRPCAWFFWGAECNRHWIELSSPFIQIVESALCINALAVATMLVRVLRASRKRRAGLYWNAYERTCAASLFTLATLLSTAADIDGSARLVPTWLRFGAQSLSRWAYEVALIEVGTAHRRALRHFSRASYTSRPSAALSYVLTNDARCAIICSFLAYNVCTKVWEVMAVPPQSRRGCVFVVANYAWQVGLSTLELAYVLMVIPAARQARRTLAAQYRQSFSSCGTELASSRNAIQVITAHIIAVSLLTVFIFSYVVVTAVRNLVVGNTYRCVQPPCTPYGYLSNIAWALWFHVGAWLAVLALVPNRVVAFLSAAAVPPLKPSTVDSRKSSSSAHPASDDAEEEEEEEGGDGECQAEDDLTAEAADRRGSFSGIAWRALSHRSLPGTLRETSRRTDQTRPPLARFLTRVRSGLDAVDTFTRDSSNSAAYIFFFEENLAVHRYSTSSSLPSPSRPSLTHRTTLGSTTGVEPPGLDSPASSPGPAVDAHQSSGESHDLSKHP